MRGSRKLTTMPTNVLSNAAGNIADRLDQKVQALRAQEAQAIERREEPKMWQQRHQLERQAWAARMMQQEFKELEH